MINEDDFAEDVCYEILTDLKDRRGFRQLFDELDEDVENEIIEEWKEKIINQIRKHKKDN